MENVIMQSKKISKDKIMRKFWIALAVLFVVWLIIMCVQYIPIKNAQDFIVDSLDWINKNEMSSRGELLSRTLAKLNSGEETFTSKRDDEWGMLANAMIAMNNAERKELIAKTRLELALNGYKDDMETYLMHGTFWQYLFNNKFEFVLFIVILLLFIMLLIGSILYIADKKTELVIYENEIIGKKIDGKTVQFLLKDIKSVETTKTQGLKITGAGIKYDIHLIENAEEMKNILMDMLAKVQHEQPVVAVVGSSANDIKEYKELLDAGIITQEEFDAKKKQLLGL